VNSESSSSVGEKLVALLSLLKTAGNLIGAAIDGGASRALMLSRQELRRIVTALALALTAALFTCVAAGFAAAALVEALGDTHRLLAYCLLAVIFVLLAALSAMLIHRQTAPDHSSRQ
jgi:hypothetical protein